MFQSYEIKYAGNWTLRKSDNFLSHCTECFNWFYLQYTCLLCCHVTENLNILDDCTVKHAYNKVPGTGVF